MSGDKLRILFLLTQDLESPSGLGRYWPLARELATRGHQVRIVALHSNYAALKEHTFFRDGVQIEYAAPMHVLKQGSHKQYYSSFRLVLVALRAVWALSGRSLAAPADIIQVCKPHPMNSIAGLLAARLRGGLLCVDCDDYEAHSNRFGSGWQHRVVAYFEQRIPRLAQIVTTHTYYMHDKLTAWGTPEKRIHYLSNGVDQSRLTQPDPVSVSVLRQRLGLLGSRVVAYLGSMSLASHPVDTLVAAFKIIAERNDNAILLLVGGGEDMDVLQRLSQQLGLGKMVRFTGRVLPEEMPMYYALADVSVDPVYDDEPARGRSPLKMFESWAMGVPFVTSPVGERVRLAGEPSAAQLSEPAGDAQALAEAILQILDNPALADTLRQRGYEQLKAYTWDRLSRQMESIYQDALGAVHERKR